MTNNLALTIYEWHNSSYKIYENVLIRDIDNLLSYMNNRAKFNRYKLLFIVSIVDSKSFTTIKLFNFDHKKFESTSAVLESYEDKFEKPFFYISKESKEKLYEFAISLIDRAKYIDIMNCI